MIELNLRFYDANFSKAYWQLSRDGNLHGSDMSHAMIASPKPFRRAPWRVGDTMVGRGNAGWTTSKSGHPCPCQNCSHGPPAEKTGGGSLLNRPLYPPDDLISQGTELKWTVPKPELAKMKVYWSGLEPQSVCLPVEILTSGSPRTHLQVVGMLRFMSKT